jgi:hypothetical protein
MTSEKFRALPKKDLVRRHDVLMDPQQTLGFLDPDDYLNELRCRETERQRQRLEYLTWAVTALTGVIAVATLALLFYGGEERRLDWEGP